VPDVDLLAATQGVLATTTPLRARAAFPRCRTLACAEVLLSAASIAFTLTLKGEKRGLCLRAVLARWHVVSRTPRPTSRAQGDCTDAAKRRATAPRSIGNVDRPRPGRVTPDDLAAIPAPRAANSLASTRMRRRNRAGRLGAADGLRLLPGHTPALGDALEMPVAPHPRSPRDDEHAKELVTARGEGEPWAWGGQQRGEAGSGPAFTAAGAGHSPSRLATYPALGETTENGRRTPRRDRPFPRRL
jgi:hypothetical protein